MNQVSKQTVAVRTYLEGEVSGVDDKSMTDED